MSWVGRFFVLTFAFGSSLHAAERYAAMFADGSRVEEAEVRDWNDLNAQAKIGGRVLFDQANPVRWIIDRQQPPVAKPAMYVEFAGGDCLAGEVIGFGDGRENPYETRPPYLIVRSTADIQPPEVPPSSELRVATESVQRVVWEHVGSEEHRPSTVWLRTGTSISFRSLRWTATGVILLTNEGVKNLSLGDLGEIHLPKQNAWDAYYDQLAALTPNAKSRIVQIQANDGGRWTTSVERLQARHHGDRNRPDHWYQLIQPAWCLDPVWLRYRSIRAWRMFAPNEVPLTNLVPATVKHQATFGGAWDYQTDQNVQRGPLQSLDKEFGWGMGVHGSTELVFEVPELARAVRTQFGLDRIAGIGGCVTAQLVIGNAPPVMNQANMIGAAQVGSMNWLDIPAGPSDYRKLTFRTDMAHVGRPPGADPFDVRDIFNWYEPEIRLDQVALEAEVLSRGAARVPGLLGWTISPADQRSMIVGNVVDAYDGRDPQFRPVVRSSDRFYTLTRQLKVGATDRWLSIVAARFAENTTPTAIQVRIDGRVMGEFDVPIRNNPVDPEPLLVPTSLFQGRTVQVELIAYPSDDKSWVDWRGISIGADRPGLQTVFEDDEKFASILNRTSGKVENDTEKPFSGKRSLKVTPDAGDNAMIPGLDSLIAEQPRLGQYRFIVFAWKKSSGSRIQLQLANQGRFGDGGPIGGTDRRDILVRRGLRRTQTVDERGQRFGYCYEQGTVTAQSPFPLWLHGDLPREWQVVQRDLFGDFGVFSVTGVSLRAVDGDVARYDHIYLARTYQDLEYAASYLVNPQPPSPQLDGNGFLAIHRREEVTIEFSRFAPLFSAAEISHGLVRNAEHNGQTDVVRTHPNAPDKPLILRTGVVLPADRKLMLDMHCTHQPECDWQLIVRANGEILYDQLINAALTTPQRGWATIQVDLSKFAGQKVLLEVVNQSNNWQNESAFWKKIALVPQ